MNLTGIQSRGKKSTYKVSSKQFIFYLWLRIIVIRGNALKILLRLALSLFDVFVLKELAAISLGS